MEKVEYKHREAFCLMVYADKHGAKEVLWNSRDGVSPFIITSKNQTEMQHVRWDLDRCDPGYKPDKGERIFIDNTDPSVEHVIRAKAVEFVNKYWDHETMPMSKHEYYREMTKEAAIDHQVQSWQKPAGQPTVVTVVDWENRIFEA